MSQYQMKEDLWWSLSYIFKFQDVQKMQERDIMSCVLMGPIISVGHCKQKKMPRLSCEVANGG